MKRPMRLRASQKLNLGPKHLKILASLEQTATIISEEGVADHLITGHPLHPDPSRPFRVSQRSQPPPILFQRLQVFLRPGNSFCQQFF